jgi:hypothetical protein
MAREFVLALYGMDGVSSFIKHVRVGRKVSEFGR